MKPRILFVDDEPDVLSGLRRMLHHRRADWDLDFCPSGAEALARLEQLPCDVIVSDVRMPEMDGPALLGAVQQLYPGIVRIALSGESNQETAVRSVGATHRFLAKPCSPAALEAVLDDALSLRGLVRDPRLQALISQVGALPTIPPLYEQLTRELESEKASAQSIGEIVAQDPGLTARVLHIASSAFFGLAHPVTTPQEAVMYIGVEVLRMLVLSDQAFARVASDPVPGLSARRVMEHSFNVARQARALAQHDGAGRLQRDGGFSAGLLHDLGKLIVAEACPERYRECLALVAHRHIPLYEAERIVFDATHAGLAGYLFALWGLPPIIFEGVAQHHSIGEALADGTVDARNLSDPQMVALRVHVADLAEHLRDAEGAGFAAEAGFARLAGTALGPRVAEWRRALMDSEERRSAA